MATIITVPNQGGGTGKTATSAALVTELCLTGRKMLGVDLDPQEDLGFCLRLEATNHHTVLGALKGLAPMRKAICQADRCDILASDIALNSRVEQAATEHRECTLKSTLVPVMGEYDYVIADTPLALSSLTVNAYTVSDYLIVSMASGALSLIGLTQLKEAIGSVKGGLSPRLRVLGILLTGYNKRALLSREVLDIARQLAQQIDTVAFESKIRNGVAITRAPTHGEDMFDYSPRSATVKNCMAFTDEIAKTIHLKEA